MNKVFVGGVVAMSAVLILSNYLVRFPVGDWLTYAAFTYPVAFLVADCVNRAAGAKTAAKVAVFGFVFGAPLSFLFIVVGGGGAAEGARIACASGVAFACAQGADIAVFNRLRNLRTWYLPPLLSSAPASLLDTVLFFSLAFAGTEVPWATLAVGDFAVKALMVVALLPPYRAFIMRRAAGA